MNEYLIINENPIMNPIMNKNPITNESNHKGVYMKESRITYPRPAGFPTNTRGKWTMRGKIS